jgi:hypothetical protein
MRYTLVEQSRSNLMSILQMMNCKNDGPIGIDMR